MKNLQLTDSIRDKLNREKLVETLKINGFISSNNVQKAILSIPRHFFVDPALSQHAYRDCRLPIGCEQTISKPSTVALMTELLDIQPNHRILEIGTGCGYQTAVLAKLAKKVYSVEWHPALVKFSKTILEELGLTTVRVEQGDGSQGWPAAAPFDRIIFTAGAPTLPQDVCYQLVDSGVMVVPTGPRDNQIMNRITRTDGKDDVFFDITNHGICEFVDLVGKNGW